MIMSNNSLSLIREAYSKAIVQSIESNDFSQSKFLLDSLEKLSSEFLVSPMKSVPVSTSDNSDSNILSIESPKQSDYGVDTDTMRDFAINYVVTHGLSRADVVTDAFEEKYKEKFNIFDLSYPAKNSAPRWRNRFHNVIVHLRQDGVFMPHQAPLHYIYALTPEYANYLKNKKQTM